MPVNATPGVIFTPSATKVPTPTNYIGSDDFDFTTQYLPDLYAQITDRFGSQMITGMLERLGKEMAFKSDDIKWTEEGRLTQLGTGVTRSSNVFTLNNHTFRVNETIIVQDDAGTAERKGLVTAVTTNTFTALCGDAAGWTAIGTADIVVYAYSNEFAKKSGPMSQSLNSQVEYFNQKPIIIKELVDESGSNLAQITWVEITDGPKTGYCWYYKNYNDTEKRFKNAIESGLIEGELWGGDLLAAGYEGTQGLFSQVREGNIFDGMATDLDDFDEIIERMNAQGMIGENYIYNKTAMGSAIDDMLKAEMVTALSWGAFNNDENMALNLEFKGFHRAGYEFYKSRWRYLDNPTTSGSRINANTIHGVMIPAGSKKVYDVIQGESAVQPMLHVRYRASEATNRKYKMVMRSFEQGTTAGFDFTATDWLTERALVVLGRNNTMLFEG